MNVIRTIDHNQAVNYSTVFMKHSVLSPVLLSTYSMSKWGGRTHVRRLSNLGLILIFVWLPFQQMFSCKANKETIIALDAIKQYTG